MHTQEDRVDKTLRELANAIVADHILTNPCLLDVPVPELEETLEYYTLKALVRRLPELKYEPLVIVVWRKRSSNVDELHVDLYRASTWHVLNADLMKRARVYKRWREKTEPGHWQALDRAQKKAQEKEKEDEHV